MKEPLHKVQLSKGRGRGPFGRCAIDVYTRSAALQAAEKGMIPSK